MEATAKPTKLANTQYISLFIINLITTLSFYMVSATISLHVKGLGMSIADTGTIVGVMSIAAMAARPFSGWISDVMNRKLVFLLSLFVICLCMVGYGFTKTAGLFLLLRIVHGVSFGICTTVLMALIAGHIPEGRLGEGMGYFGLGNTLAVAVGPAIGLAIGNRFGFNFTFFLSSACLVATMVLGLIIVRPQGSPAGSKAVPIGKTIRLENIFIKDAVLFGVFAIAVSSTNGLESSMLTLYGKQLGLDNIGWYFTISAVVMLFSRVVFGKMMDKRGFSIVFYPGMALIAAAMILLSQANHLGAVTVFVIAAVLKALGVGAIQPSLQAQCIKTVPPEKRGAASSTYYFGADIGQGTSPIIGGALSQSSGYPAAFLFYIVPIALVVALYGFTRGKAVRRAKAQA